MKRKLRRTIFGAVALVMSAAVLLTACGDGKNKPKAEISVWSATSTEKILQDKTYEGRSNNGYAVKVFKNEAEAAPRNRFRSAKYLSMPVSRKPGS